MPNTTPTRISTTFRQASLVVYSCLTTTRHHVRSRLWRNGWFPRHAGFQPPLWHLQPRAEGICHLGKHATHLQPPPTRIRNHLLNIVRRDRLTLRETRRLYCSWSSLRRRGSYPARRDNYKHDYCWQSGQWRSLRTWSCLRTNVHFRDCAHCCARHVGFVPAVEY